MPISVPPESWDYGFNHCNPFINLALIQNQESREPLNTFLIVYHCGKYTRHFVFSLGLTQSRLKISVTRFFILRCLYSTQVLTYSQITQSTKCTQGRLKRTVLETRMHQTYNFPRTENLIDQSSYIWFCFYFFQGLKVIIYFTQNKVRPEL